MVDKADLAIKRIDIDRALEALKHPDFVPIYGSFGDGCGETGGECCLVAALVGVEDPDVAFEELGTARAAKILGLDINYVAGLMSGWDNPNPLPGDETASACALGRLDGSLVRRKAGEGGIVVVEGSDVEEDDDDWDEDDEDDDYDLGLDDDDDWDEDDEDWDDD